MISLSHNQKNYSIYIDTNEDGTVNFLLKDGNDEVACAYLSEIEFIELVAMLNVVKQNLSVDKK